MLKNCRSEKTILAVHNALETVVGDMSNFAIIGKCKAKWLKAKKLLDREIQAYRNAALKAATTTAAAAAPATQIAQDAVEPPLPMSAPPAAANGKPMPVQQAPQPSGPAGSPSPAILNAPDLAGGHPPSPPPPSTAVLTTSENEDQQPTTQTSVFLPQQPLQVGQWVIRLIRLIQVNIFNLHGTNAGSFPVPY